MAHDSAMNVAYGKIRMVEMRLSHAHGDPNGCRQPAWGACQHTRAELFVSFRQGPNWLLALYRYRYRYRRGEAEDEARRGEGMRMRMRLRSHLIPHLC